MADSGKSYRPRAVSSAARSTTSSIGAHRSHKSLVSSPHPRTEIYEDSDDSDQDDDDEDDDEDDEDDDDDVQPPTHQALPRSHTPGHLASKSVNDRTTAAAAAAAAKQVAELAVRQRSQSASQVPPRPSTTGGSKSQARPQHPPPPPPPPTTSDDADKDGKRGGGGGGGYTRTASVLTSKSNPPGPSSRSASGAALSQVPKGEHVAFPPLQDPKDAPDTPAAPASGMYWSRAPVSGAPHSQLRAHTTTLIGSNVYVFGGCDARTCFNTVYVLDADAFYWSVPHVVGEVPAPLRAMTCTAVGRKLVVFGGGDGPAYYNDVYVLDTVNFRWTRPRVLGGGERGGGGAAAAPSRRRAHTACLYKNGIYVFGGGDGVRALNDIWRLDVSDTTKMSWRLVSSGSESGGGTPPSGAAGKDQRRPKARGYHTANMVGSKLIIYGGSDGGECFDDVWVYDVETHVWKTVSVPVTFRRLSHTATIVGSYLFVIGGHDGAEYCDDVLLLNLVTMTWDRRRVYGQGPTGRGYHGTVLHDSRLITVGGFDGSDVFGDVHILELAVHAYYSQISHFTIEV